MTLVNSGQIALSDIMGETSMLNKVGYSLDYGENGQTDKGYPKINLCSTYRPSDNDGCSLSEWWGYNHYQQCNLYRWTAVYNDSNPDICSATPTNTPNETNTPSSCIERVTNNTCVCIGADPQLMTPTGQTYDNYVNKLIFLNYYNNVYNLKVYNGLGQELWSLPGPNTSYTNGAGYYINGSLSLSSLFGAQSLYFVSFNYDCIGTAGNIYCSTYRTYSSNGKLYWAGTQSIGSVVGTPALYSQDTSGTVACSLTNQIRYVYYALNNTTSSAGSGTYFYFDVARTIAVPQGAYVFANGYKFIVNSSGMVSSYSLTCTPNSNMFDKFFRNQTMKVIFYSSQTIYPLGTTVNLPEGGSYVSNGCYILENATNPSGCYIRGVVTEYNSNTGEITISNYTGECS